MAKIRRNFISGSMNQDIDERLLPEGQYRSALNVDIIHSEGEDSGAVKNKKGNVLKCDLSEVSGVQSISNARTIGAVTDPTKGMIYWLVSSDEFDGIFEYNEANGVCSRILQATKASPSEESVLNFHKDYYVTGINFIDGFLYWTDDLNEPRRIKIERCKSYLVDDARIEEDIRVIVSAPPRSPSITLIDLPGQENNIEDRFVQFAFRWRNKDNQYSAMSPFSATAFEGSEYEIDFGAGENKAMRNRHNAVDVHFETGTSFVKEIQLLVRDTKSLNVSIVETFRKDDLGIPDDSVYTHRFSNSKVLSALESSQVARLFDNVPIKAKAQDIVGRRIMYGNYTQFYDIKRLDGTKINVDFQVGHVSKDVVSVGTPERTFRSDRDYELAVIYGDDDGRFSTPITAENNTTFIPLSKSVKANSLTIDIDSDPPVFATQYRVVIKQSKKNYYNVFPILYYADGPFRYFLINGSDIDKFKVGDYVIFKADIDGPISIPNSYKVLEIEAKGTDFLSNGNSQIAGVYFKIKVDNSSDFNPNALFTFYREQRGTNIALPLNSGPQPATVVPVKFRHAVAEKAIHYGNGDPLGMAVVGNNQYNYTQDFRVTIEIEPGGTTFRRTVDLTASSGWQTGIPITGAPQWVILNNVQAFQIQFNNSFNLVPGDQWKVNCRAAGHLPLNVFGGVGIPLDGVLMSPGDWGGAAVLPGDTWSPTSSPETDRPIETGAIIKIQVINDSLNPSQQEPVQQFPPSPRRYDNIEEWFIESGAYQAFKHFDINGIDIGSEGVTFRRGSYWRTPLPLFGQIYQGQVLEQGSNPVTLVDLGITQEALDYPVHMIVQGFGFGGQNDPNTVRVSFEIQQAENLAQCETKAIETESDIFYETLRTFPISNNKHRVLWPYEDFTFDFDNFNTVLGQAVPGDPDTEGLIPHHFNVGDQVRVESPNINGVFTITVVPDRYNIIIDLPFPGAGPVTGGFIELYHPEHQQRNQTPAMPASIRIGNPLADNSDFNAFSFGNGIESDRVLDDFNETTIDYSPRATISVDIYERERKESSVTYSGIYRSESSLNRLNEFNLSLSNFKNLETKFGSVQKLYGRDTDLVVFQESKVSRVLAGKNLLSDSTGGGSVTSVPQVLGTQIPYSGEWGISSNPESFAFWGGDIYFTDARRGAVIAIRGESIDISKTGMSAYFRNLFKDNPDTQKIGVYNPRTHRYIIASNDSPSVACQLDLTALVSSFPGNTSGDITEIPDQDKPTFGVISNTDWTTSIVYSTGSDWLAGIPASGFGNQEFFVTLAPNNTSQIRTVTITFTYCNGQTVDHVITQASGSEEYISVIING